MPQKTQREHESLENPFVTRINIKGRTFSVKVNEEVNSPEMLPR
jgi:hypothetical protein